MNRKKLNHEDSKFYKQATPPELQIVLNLAIIPIDSASVITGPRRGPLFIATMIEPIHQTP